MQPVGGELEEGVGVVSCVGTNGLDGQGETAEQGAKPRHGEEAVLTVGPFGLIPKREFDFGADDHL